MSEIPTPPSLTPPSPEADHQSHEVMARTADAARTALYGIRNWSAERRLGHSQESINDAFEDMEEAGSRMERMDRKNTLYGYVGEMALYGESDIQQRNGSLGQNERPRPQTRTERLVERHILNRAFNKEVTQSHRAWTVKTYGNEKASQQFNSITGRPFKGSTKNIKAQLASGEMYDEMDAKRDGLVADAEALELSARSTTDYLGAAKMMKAAEAKRKAASQITPASWKAAKFLEAKLTYDKVENPEQRRTRRDVKSVSKSLYRAATQPIASRWRNHRREVAIGDIKTNYRKATVDIPEKQLKLEEKRDRIQEKLNNVQNRRQARRNP